MLECILVRDDESHSGWDMTVDTVNEVVSGDPYIISPPTNKKSSHGPKL